MSTVLGVSLRATPKWAPKVLLPYMVNSVAISDDGKRAVAGYYYFPYPGTTELETHGAFCTFCCDSDGKRLWSNQYQGCQGIFAVAISGDGAVAAAGGLETDAPAFQGRLCAYDASNGKVLLDYKGIVGVAPPAANDTGRRQRVSCVALSRNGEVLAAAADRIYIFVRDQAGTYSAQPTGTIEFPDVAQAVAVHPTGEWLAACDKGGNICMATISNGTVQEQIRFPTEKAPINRDDSNSQEGNIVFLSVAISKNDNSFVVGGGDYVYLFRRDPKGQQPPMIKGDTFRPGLSIPPPLPAGAPPRTTPPQNVRWVAISDAGDCVTAVVNRYENGAKTGSLLRFDEKLCPVWDKPLPRNPNSTSVDGAGKYVTACDGYPVGTPSAFYLFDATTGVKLWEYPTTNMNWPMVISNDGAGIAAGGDDGLLYFFDPNQLSG